MNNLYPRVYDKMTTDFNNNGLATLDKVYDYRIYERLNGEYTLSFSMPQNDPKMQYVKEENYIKAKGQLFIIRRITETRAIDNTLLAFVECEHIFFELLDKFIENFETNYDNAQFILDRLLFETRFTGNAISVPDSKSFSITQRTAVSGINSILERWECEIKRDNFHVELKPQIGVVRPAEIKYTKNLRSITRIVDSSNIITKLYVYGQDGLTIPPLESQYIGNYPVAKEGSITFGLVTTTETLQEQGQAYLERVEVPKASYEVGIVELKRLPGFEDEEFEIGDTISIVDEDLGIDMTARVVEYDEYPLEPKRSTVVIANFIDNITDQLSRIDGDLRDTKNKVDRTIGENGKIDTFWLDGQIDVLKNRFESTISNWYTDENGNIIFESLNGTSAMKLAGDGLAIANSKVGGEWQWTTFGTGEGFTANLINAGILNAALVRIIAGNYVNIDGNGFHVVDPNNVERFRAGQIDTDEYGVEVTQGKIYGTLIRTGDKNSQTYIELNPDGDLSGFKDGNRIIFMQSSANEGRIMLSDKTDISNSLNLDAAQGYTGNVYASVTATGDRDGLLLRGVGTEGIVLERNGDINIYVRSTSNNQVTIKGDVTIDGELRVKKDVWVDGFVDSTGGFWGTHHG
ncbi:phage minor structural protein, N-terminal region [Anaerovirgula multivorans]|uniref:Phage minor structural protein, N-terminal region n=1 Tax=Anaerovirgula multivorans TaxID=312168 RepID=A0A239AIZ7_9FIRM|nr:phage tail spike protein [Anaerovirgula multivorans]SNR95322.1 phage minor structural protein, N-terminal region [Anaerovirgula multivorans]